MEENETNIHPELGERSTGERGELDREDPQSTSGGKEEKKSPSDPRLNQAIPLMIATTVFGSPPTSHLPEGVEATEASELSQKYVTQTAPILEIISFHECLDVITELSPTVRLIIGTAVLGIGIAILKPKKIKEEKESAD